MIYEAFSDELKKIASLAGQDLRKPFTGMSTNFPTGDSKSFSNKLLQQSKKSADTGVSPSIGSLAPKGPSVQDLAPKMSTSTKGSIPKIGAAMNLADDPLARYLRKQAMQLENNLDALPTKSEDDPITEEDTGPMESAQAVPEHKSYLGKLFDNKDFRKKFDGKFKK